MALYAIVIFLLCSMGLLRADFVDSFAVYENPFQLMHKDMVLGHHFFKKGCIVGDRDHALVTFDMNGLVEGDVFFKGHESRLKLQADLMLGSSVRLHKPFIESHGQGIILRGNIQQDDIFTVVGDLTINGMGNAFELNKKATFFLVSDFNQSSTLRLKNMTLIVKNDEINGLLACGDRGTVVLDNVSLVLLRDCIVSDLFINILNRVNVEGYGKTLTLEYPYSFSGVHKGGTLFLGQGVTFISRFYDKDSFGCLDDSATLWFDGCSIDSSFRQGWRIDKGHIIFENNVSFDSQKINQKEQEVGSFELGNDGISEAKALVLPGAQVKVNNPLFHNPL